MKQCALFLCLAILLASPVFANEVRDKPFAQKMANADIVVIATAVETQPASASVAIVRILKGRPPKKLKILTDTGISEFNPDCCEVGATYLMFLQRAKNGQFVSSLGKHGIVRIGAPRQE